MRDFESRKMQAGPCKSNLSAHAVSEAANWPPGHCPLLLPLYIRKVSAAALVTRKQQEAQRIVAQQLAKEEAGNLPPPLLPPSSCPKWTKQRNCAGQQWSPASLPKLSWSQGGKKI